MLSPRPCKCILDVLADHVLLLILEKLEDRADRNNWSLVCKQFLRLRATLQKSAVLLRAEVVHSYLQRYRDLKRLNLSFGSRVTDFTLLSISQLASRHLRSLNLSKARMFTDSGLAVLTRGCSSLTDLDLSFCNQVTDLGMVAVAQLKNLQSLNLEMCKGISDVGLSYLSTGCRGLLHLSLRWSGISDVAVIVVGYNCTKLISLDLSYTEISNIGVASITRLENLENLSLAGCHNVDDEGLACLRDSFKSLQTLDLSRCLNVSCMAFTGLGQGHLPLRQLTLSYCQPITDALLRSFQHFEGLQSVKFDGCDVGAADLSCLGASCKALKELSLSKCKGVEDFVLCAALAGFRSLQMLDLTCCRELTNLTLISIASFCKSLVTLRMESCFCITDVGFSALGEACHCLEDLDFTDSSLNDGGLMSLSRCTTLKVLKLGYCTISDEGLEYISSNCSNLLELDLYRCSDIGDAGVAAIATGCSKLRNLNLAYCSKITDTGLQKIANLHELQYLQIRGCCLASSIGLSAVAKGCCQLVELDLKWCSFVDDSAILALAENCANLRQINLSYCAVGDYGLIAIAKLNHMQNMKLIDLKNASPSGFGAALLGCGSLKKVKLPSEMKVYIPVDVIEQLESRDCRINWIPKLPMKNTTAIRS